MKIPIPVFPIYFLIPYYFKNSFISFSLDSTLVLYILHFFFFFRKFIFQRENPSSLTSQIRSQCHHCWRLAIAANWSCRFPIVWPIEGWIGEGAGAACAWHCSSATGGWRPSLGVEFAFFEPVVKCWQPSAEVGPFLSPIRIRTLRIKYCSSWNTLRYENESSMFIY